MENSPTHTPCSDPHWVATARFYHIFPLGFSTRGEGLARLTAALDPIVEMGFNAIYAGPLWHSHSHGYDTIDYGTVDPRLGNNEDLKRFVTEAHKRGIKVVLDGVFNHVGRGFHAFEDLLENHENSAFAHWFGPVQFHKNNAYNDGLSYQCWEGSQDLVQLDTANPDVIDYLLGMVDQWVREFQIDGLRLDAADCVSPLFWERLRHQCDGYGEFWLMGEVIHGDYNRWLGEKGFHAVTNYEVHKGLWSSFKDHNLFEIAYSLRRQFGEGGIYERYCLYNFLDNHDVTRVASRLKTKRQLIPMHLLLYTVPGIPSIYYGSEWYAKGRKKRSDDWHLRPSEEVWASLSSGSPSLRDYIVGLNAMRRDHPVLATGRYKELLVQSDQLVFERRDHNETLICCINGAPSPVRVALPLPKGHYEDILTGTNMEIDDGCTLPPCGGRVLKVK
ncbi:alpha-glucosidase C-terminal domain-containing protein [Myxococcota bacterium]|nr:alpha-glucosidase C-terminal domain-containing protein [Myxococcota bacterium]MBU1534906.1 alpha-glucosidase C-terminal domain-containing protein [Myxococcota bacterium]